MLYDQLCQQVTAKIAAAIETGDTGTWQAPWHHNGTADLFNPTNAFTGRPYTGANTLILAIAAIEAEYPTGTWATYRQWQQAGGQVRRGEHGTRCIKWINRPARSDQANTTDIETRPATVMVPRVFTVFNITQTNGYQPPTDQRPTPPDPIPAVEAFITGTGAEIDYGFNTAVYRRLIDRIQVPAINQYNEVEDHYATVLHELVHWTGHPTRLNRTFGERNGDDAYAIEELVAELGAAFATARLGITNQPRPDHASYIGHWLQALDANPRLLFQLATKAQAAVDHLAAYSQPSTATEEAA